MPSVVEINIVSYLPCVSVVVRLSRSDVTMVELDAISHVPLPSELMSSRGVPSGRVGCFVDGCVDGRVMDVDTIG